MEFWLYIDWCTNFNNSIYNWSPLIAAESGFTEINAVLTQTNNQVKSLETDLELSKSQTDKGVERINILEEENSKLQTSGNELKTKLSDLQVSQHYL